MTRATTAARPAGRLLPLLHLLGLLRVPLLQLLRLLLVLLLHVLHFLRGSILFRKLLMFVVLLLLQCLPVLVLLRNHALLLLLKFLVHLRIAGIGSSWAFDWRQFLRMRRKIRARSRRKHRRTVVRGNPLLGVVASSISMLSLRSDRGYMLITRGSFLLRVGPLVDAAITPVITGAAAGALIYSRVVNIVDGVLIHVVYRCVVEEMSTLPPPAIITVTEVAVAIVDPAIETYRRAPVAVIKEKPAAAPTPIARSPKVADFRSHHPSARHPVIFTVPSPIARRPDITVAGTNRLIVNGQLRRSDGYRYADLRKGSRRQE